MKYNVLFVLSIFLCSFNQVHSQVYYPFPDSNAIWNTAGDNIFTSFPIEARFGLYGDTTINSKQYSKVYRLFDSTLLNPLSQYFGAIREDTQKRIYMRMPEFDTLGEFLLYDFSAKVGDTIWYQIGGYAEHGYNPYTHLWINFYFFPELHFNVVDSIDSIQLLNYEYRKKWTMTWASVDDSWIEGIGSNGWFGLIGPIISHVLTNGDGFQFACFKQNDTVLFLHNMNCSKCFCDNFVMSISEINLIHGNSIQIKYDKLFKEIEIKNVSTDSPIVIQIWNSLGQQIFNRQTNDWNTRISVSELNTGLYILVVKNTLSKVLDSRKIVISNY